MAIAADAWLLVGEVLDAEDVVAGRAVLVITDEIMKKTRWF